ncbi:MAG: DUF2384 domain-containing protein [Flavobacterium sp.]|nr:DUF2384 domain-containing protein [Flavobacterium sp.]
MKNSKPINYQEYHDTENLQSLNEPMLAYMPATFFKNNVLDNLTQNSKDLFVSLVKNTGLTIKILAENIFEITPKTFIKYKNNETKIPSRITELAIEINTLYALGNEIFGTSESFNNWLESNNQFFNNRKPAAFLNTSTGIHYVFEEVKRIEFGATA